MCIHLNNLKTYIIYIYIFRKKTLLRTLNKNKTYIYTTHMWLEFREGFINQLGKSNHFQFNHRQVVHIRSTAQELLYMKS